MQLEHEIRKDITALQVAAAASCMDGKAVMELFQHFERNLNALKDGQTTSANPQPQTALSVEEFRKQIGEG